MTEHDEFYFPSGLKDDYVGVVTDGWFGKTENGPNLMLFLKVAAEDGEEVENRYGCGGDWETFDGGETAEHPTAKGFNNRTKIATLTAACFEAGAEDAIRERSKTVTGGKGPKHAKLFVGMRGHWFVKTEEFTNREGEKQSMNTVLMDKYIGWEDVASGTSAPAAAASSAGAGAGAGADSSDPLSTVDASVAAQIKVLAQSQPYPEWVDSVMPLQGVLQSTTLMSALSNEAFYNSLKA